MARSKYDASVRIIAIAVIALVVHFCISHFFCFVCLATNGKSSSENHLSTHSCERMNERTSERIAEVRAYVRFTDSTNYRIEVVRSVLAFACDYVLFRLHFFRHSSFILCSYIRSSIRTSVSVVESFAFVLLNSKQAKKSFLFELCTSEVDEKKRM